jgi:hypothetical protein
MHANFKNKTVIYGVSAWLGMSRVAIITTRGKIAADVIKVHPI